jgi:hypothetical protein
MTEETQAHICPRVASRRFNPASRWIAGERPVTDESWIQWLRALLNGFGRDARNDRPEALCHPALLPDWVIVINAQPATIGESL